jgi:hypothetical protein
MRDRPSLALQPKQLAPSAKALSKGRHNGGINAASKAVQSAIRGEKMEAEIFQTHQIVAAKRGIIASRIGGTMSARTPNR